MPDKNVQIVQESFEQLFNAKRLDRTYDYYSDQCVFHNPPYVGLGIGRDETCEEQIVVGEVAPGGPAAGKVLVGDVLLRAADGETVWEGYEQLRTGMWGRGKLGTEVRLTLRREGETCEVAVVRGRVEGFDSSIANVLLEWRRNLAEMPDLRCAINHILGSGDMVALFATNTCTNSTYQQSAIWTECDIFRVENDKIVEQWGADDGLSYYLQLGFHLLPPGV